MSCIVPQTSSPSSCWISGATIACFSAKTSSRISKFRCACIACRSNANCAPIGCACARPLLAAPLSYKAHLGIMSQSVSTFCALFRHALIAMGQPMPANETRSSCRGSDPNRRRPLRFSRHARPERRQAKTQQHGRRSLPARLPGIRRGSNQRSGSPSRRAVIAGYDSRLNAFAV